MYETGELRGIHYAGAHEIGNGGGTRGWERAKKVGKKIEPRKRFEGRYVKRAGKHEALRPCRPAASEA